MSDYTFLVPGFIPTDCISSPGELDQMVADAQPVSNVSFNYYSATAPDIITYPALSRCIWVDTHTTPYVKRLYSSATSSWVIEVPAPGSITGAMIADHTITLAKLKASIYGANTVAQVNSSSTAWQAVPASTLFSSSYRLDINSISLSAVGAYVFSSNGVTNSWSTFASYLTAGVVPLTAIATTGAADPSVLSFVGGTLGYRTVVAATADATLPVGKLVPGAVNYFAVTDPTGAFVTWISPAQVYALVSSSINATRYNTATGALQALPSVATASFGHSLGATPTRFGGFIICTLADPLAPTYSVGDKIDWTSLQYQEGTDEIYSLTMACDNLNVYLQAIPSSAALEVSGKTGATRTTLTPGSWKCGAWADSN